MKVKRKYLIWLLAFCCLVGLFSQCGKADQVQEAQPTEAPTAESTFVAEESSAPVFTDAPEVPETVSSGSMTVHFIDVGQGSSVLVESDGAFMLYDGGPSSASSKVVAYLKKQGVEKLTYCIASHYDADHLNGIVGAMHAFSVDTLMGLAEGTDSKIYQSFLRTAEEKNLAITMPKAGEVYPLGSATFTVLSPNKEYADENASSIALRIDCGDNSFFLGGDATKESEADMIRSGRPLDVDVYYVNHHGSDTSSSGAFVRALSPSAAVISVGKNNSYGHPSSETMQVLTDAGCDIYRTDEQGDIVATCDGKTILWNVIPYAVVTDEQPEELISNDVTYILNTNTKKFHYPSCSSVASMKESNRRNFYGTRDEAIGMGYQPCGRCHP